MRSAAEIKNLITGFAEKDDRIRAVLLNGSRVDAKVIPDIYQDFDVVFIVSDVGSFTKDHSWTNIFGDKFIEQLPEEITFDKKVKPAPSFTYLMLFKDGNRIDLSIFPVDKIKTFKPESLSLVWVDKDGLFKDLPPPADSDHHIKAPSQKDYSDTCNEFWWVSTYIAKGLKRKQLLYSKEMMETVVRPMLMKMVAWSIADKNNYQVDTGKAGKFLQHLMPAEDYAKILKTYAGSAIVGNWRALFLMTALFSRYAKEISTALNFTYNETEEKNTLAYLEQLYNSK